MVALESPELRQSHGTGQQTHRKHRAAARGVVGEPYAHKTVSHEHYTWQELFHEQIKVLGFQSKVEGWLYTGKYHYY